MGDLFLSEDVRILLKNKSVCIIGDSVQRTIYKDFITLLQVNRFSTVVGLKAKGEETYMNDTLVEGGLKSGPLHNGVDYREHRLFESADHTVRFFFVTRAWDEYWKFAILPTLLIDPKPDVVIVNSCLWDLTRYGTSGGVGPYKDNLKRLLTEMKRSMPPETLFLWNTTLPLSSDPDKIHGGFLVAEVSVEDKMNLRLDILEANKFASEMVASFDYDVLDLHYWFRGHQEHRVKDGIHWNNEATRQMTNLLLTRIADSWGVGRPGRLFQIALVGSGRDPLLMRELAEAEQAIEREKNDVEENNNYLIGNNNFPNHAAVGNGVVTSGSVAHSASFHGVGPTPHSSSRSLAAIHASGYPNESASCSRLAALLSAVNSVSGPSSPPIGSPSAGESTDSCEEGAVDNGYEHFEEGTGVGDGRDRRGVKRPLEDADINDETSIPPSEEREAKKPKRALKFAV